MSKNKKGQSKRIAIQVRKLPPYLLAAMIACAIMGVIVMVSSFVAAARPPKIEFIPPKFEENAESGMPEVPNDLGYAEIYKEGMTFSAWICAEPYQENDELIVYFTNSESNCVWLKLRVLDHQGNILGESGLIRPGEYVRSVHLTEAMADDTSITMKIMGYEPETYNSVGAVSVKPKPVKKII